MNRSQRRALVKKAKKDGMKKDLAKAYAEIANGTGSHTDPQEFSEGDMVQLDVDAIKARKNYDVMSEAYKEFVESSVGKAFTAHIERKHLISLKEEPKWLFWSGDLIKATEE